MPDETFHRHSFIPASMLLVRVRPWCTPISMLHVHVNVHVTFPCPCLCQCVRVRVHVRVRVRMYKCGNVGLSGIRSVRYRNDKNNDAGTDPVPNQADAVRHFFGPVLD
jgi:hypothetical protein